MWSSREPCLERIPCPADRILHHIGHGFGSAIVVGAAFHFLKGAYNFPKGARLIGGAQAALTNAPRFAGSIAGYAALHSTYECTMVHIRQKEDPWNSIIAAAAALGSVSIRDGFASASRTALLGVVFVALIEGGIIMLHKRNDRQLHIAMIGDPTPNEASMPGYPMGLFGRLFGGGKRQES